MADVTDDTVKKAIYDEAEEDPEFHAALTAGQLSRSDVRDKVAARLDVDADAIKPFKDAMVAVMKDLFVNPEAEAPAAKPRKPRKPAAPRKKPAAAPAPAPATAPAPAAAPAVTSTLLRGTVKLDDKGRLLWKGSWAFGVDAWNGGDKSGFRLFSKKPLPKAADGVEAALPDGQWLACSGWFAIKEPGAAAGAPRRKEKETKCRLKFSREAGAWRVTGRGANAYGHWALEKGLYEPAQKSRCSAERAYGPELGTDALTGALMSDDDDDGDFDGDESDDEKPKGGKKPAAAAVRLTGTLAGAAGRWAWRGTWASKDAAGLPFELTGAATTRQGDDGTGAAPPRLDLSGSFQLREGEATRTVLEPTLSLHLAPAVDGTRAASGTGQNELGRFKLSGALDAATGVLEATKKYRKPRPESDDEDVSDDDDAGSDADPNEVNDLLTEATSYAQTTGGRPKREAASHAAAAIEKKRQRAELGARSAAARAPASSLLAWTDADLAAETAALKRDVAADGEAALVKRLRSLNSKSLTVDQLSRSGVGKVVGSLRKHDSAKVKAMASALVKRWKGVVTASAEGGK